MSYVHMYASVYMCMNVCVCVRVCVHGCMLCWRVMCGGGGGNTPESTRSPLEPGRGESKSPPSYY